MLSSQFRIVILSVVLLAFFSCKGKEAEKKAEFTQEEIKDIVANYDADDSTLVEAYLKDSSTISVYDIDMKDTTYSARSKVLYKGTGKRSLAVVYGHKTGGRMGIAIVQTGTDTPIRLKQTKGSRKSATYELGEVKLVREGDFAFLNYVQYEEIK